LVAHQRRHEGNRRFWCPYCDKKFVISSEMRDHIKRVHPGE
jgi:transposase